MCLSLLSVSSHYYGPWFGLNFPAQCRGEKDSLARRKMQIAVNAQLHPLAAARIPGIVIVTRCQMANGKCQTSNVAADR
jgi:hypothetical protein